MHRTTNSPQGQLWPDHPATTAQRRKYGKRTQLETLLEMLRIAQRVGVALELPEIMKAGIAQHGARFKELRNLGFQIDNEMVRAANGRTLSRYWLRADPDSGGRP